MSRYAWKAIPESTWAAFILAFSGLAGSLCVALGVPEYLTVAIVSFIGAFFRLLIALAAAFFSTDGTITSGTVSSPIPPSEGGQSTLYIIVAIAIIAVCAVWLLGPITLGR